MTTQFMGLLALYLAVLMRSPRCLDAICAGPSRTANTR